MEKNNFPTSLSDYEILDDIGRGRYSRLHRAFCNKNDTIVCIRIFNLDHFFGVEFDKALGRLSKEIMALKICQHKNLTEYYSCFIEGSRLYFVLEYLEGSIINILKFHNRHKLTEGVFVKDPELLRIILFQTLLGIENCHKNGLMHRNVKGDYILVNRNGEIKLSGFFGASFLIKLSGRKTSDFNYQSRMDVSWTAPEILEQVSAYNQKVDIWSFGMTILELVYGKIPFQNENQLGVYYEILTKPSPVLHEDGIHIFCPLLKEVIELCVKKKPELRPTSTELLKHKYFSKLRNNPKNMRKYVRKTLKLTNLPSLPDRNLIMTRLMKKNGIIKATENINKLPQIDNQEDDEIEKSVVFNFDKTNDDKILKDLNEMETPVSPPSNRKKTPQINEKKKKKKKKRSPVPSPTLAPDNGEGSSLQSTPNSSNNNSPSESPQKSNFNNNTSEVVDSTNNINNKNKVETPLKRSLTHKEVEELTRFLRPDPNPIKKKKKKKEVDEIFSPSTPPAMITKVVNLTTKKNGTSHQEDDDSRSPGGSVIKVDGFSPVIIMNKSTSSTSLISSPVIMRGLPDINNNNNNNQDQDELVEHDYEIMEKGDMIVQDILQFDKLKNEENNNNNNNNNNQQTQNKIINSPLDPNPPKKKSSTLKKKTSFKEKKMQLPLIKTEGLLKKKKRNDVVLVSPGSEIKFHKKKEGFETLEKKKQMIEGRDVHIEVLEKENRKILVFEVSGERDDNDNDNDDDDDGLIPTMTSSSSSSSSSLIRKSSKSPTLRKYRKNGGKASGGGMGRDGQLEINNNNNNNSTKEDENEECMTRSI